MLSSTLMWRKQLEDLFLSYEMLRNMKEVLGIMVTSLSDKCCQKCFTKKAPNKQPIDPKKRSIYII